MKKIGFFILLSTVISFSNNKNNETTSKYHVDSFLLSDAKQNIYKIVIDRKNVSIYNRAEPTILINLFTSLSVSCQEEASYIQDLHKKYRDKVFVVGLLLQNKNYEDLKQFTKKSTADYFISNNKQNDELAKKLVKSLGISKNFSLPLTILYKNGKYHRHYEGTVPIEMIEYDIKSKD